MAKYISQLAVSINSVEEQSLRNRGFMQVNVNLNKGAGGKDIYLWYKKGSSAITRLQLTFNDDMITGLRNAGYTQISKDLNAGAGGNEIYLWYFQGSGEYDIPIVDITATVDLENEAAKFQYGWQRLACDVARNVGFNWIHIWVRREEQPYICDVTATDSHGADADLFKQGYIRMDETTNRGAIGSPVFIWFRQTTNPDKAIIDLKVSITKDESHSYQQQYYKAVSVNLNEGSNRAPVSLWYKKEGSSNPIQLITLIVNEKLISEYEKVGVTVIPKNLNAGCDRCEEFLCYKQ